MSLLCAPESREEVVSVELLVLLEASVTCSSIASEKAGLGSSANKPVSATLDVFLSSDEERLLVGLSAVSTAGGRTLSSEDLSTLSICWSNCPEDDPSLSRNPTFSYKNVSLSQDCFRLAARTESFVARYSVYDNLLITSKVCSICLNNTSSLKQSRWALP